MGKREIKKTVVTYEETQKTSTNDRNQQEIEERQRSRQKEGIKNTHKEHPIKIQEMNINSRRARLEAMKKARQQQEQELEAATHPNEIQVKLQQPQPMNKTKQTQEINQEENQQSKAPKQQSQKPQKQNHSSQQQMESEDDQKEKVIKKPIFIAREFREQDHNDDQLKEEERKRKNARYTTKMLLEQQRYQDSEEENELTDSEDENNPNSINDDDTLNEELEFQLWKIRELNRIRRAIQERRKHQMQKMQVDRRRLMTNEAILLQNKQLGSDATEGDTETKYTFMQKYYHVGAFYQDSEDEVFKRDYNLPTPMEMQDKSLLPQILQKRIGNFGKKGQSKYTHLTAEDTSDLNPLTRPDQSILESWKRKTAGYKGSYGKNL